MDLHKNLNFSGEASVASATNNRLEFLLPEAVSSASKKGGQHHYLSPM